MSSRPSLLPRLALILTGALALASCSQEAPTPAADAPATQAAPAAGTDAAPAAPAATPAAADASAAWNAARTPGPVVPPSGPAPVEGTDYFVISGGQPYQASPGKIEVVEVFGYTCPHCAEFEPLVSAWADKLPADVQFTPVAAPFGGIWLPYAKAFYTAQAMGLAEKSHDAVFRALHLDRTLPPQPTPEQLGEYYAQFGADPQQFASTMQSFAINAKVNRAQQFLQRSGVDSTPTMVVAGKYRVPVTKDFNDLLRVTEHLVARERAERGGGEAATGTDAAPAATGDAAAQDPAAGDASGG